jgi:hypothetical protein
VLRTAIHMEYLGQGNSLMKTSRPIYYIYIYTVYIYTVYIYIYIYIIC